MNKNFIPSFHFVHPDKKFTKEWAVSALNYYYHNTDNRSLLDGKNVKEIDDFSIGQFSMTPFKMMYKSMKKALQRAKSPNNENHNCQDEINTTGLDWTPLPLIPTKLNSAISIVQKIPVEISCKAIDPLALEKKKRDFEFLKNKPKLENDLLPLAEEMGIGSVDLGTTKHGSVTYSESPYGLDLSDPEEADIFQNLIYSLGVEASFETVLQKFWELKSGNNFKLLEIKDQLKYGVSCNRAYSSAITGLPDGGYQEPGSVKVPHSKLPDMSDNTHRFIEDRVTVMEMFNFFGDEIKTEQELDKIINDEKTGYCCNNGMSYQNPKNWSSMKVSLIYCEVKSLDWIGVQKRNKKSKFSSFTMDEKKATEKIWSQNTYAFWWLRNTEHTFGMHRLPYALREKGRENYQGFSTNIYKSQDKSCVEMAIGENKKAQVADIKLQHVIVKSLPPGKYIDLRFIRGALTGIKDEHNQWSMEDLINLAFEQNIMIGDTEDFDKNPAAAQLKPFVDIVGGLKREDVEGYMRVIAQASMNIAAFTGINEQLTGQSANPEGLIGMQKLLINSSINALYYCNEAITHQYQKFFNIWANVIKDGVERGGKTRQAIVNAIGAKKTAIIDNLDQLSLHDINIKISISQREEERAKFAQRVERLKIASVISIADEYMLDALENPKDKIAFLAVKEKLFQKKMEKQAEITHARQQELMAQQGENQQAAIATKMEGEQKLEYTRGDVQAKLMELGNSLGLNTQQMDAFVKRILQQDRGKMALDKSLKTLEAKHNLNNQQSLIA